EQLTRVAVEGAPLLSEPEDEGAPRAVLHAGDLVRVLRTARPRLAWRGPLPGSPEPATRDGACVEVRRAAGESAAFAFRADLGGAERAPTAAWLCRRIGAGPACAERLRRVAV